MPSLSHVHQRGSQVNKKTKRFINIYVLVSHDKVNAENIYSLEGDTNIRYYTQVNWLLGGLSLALSTLTKISGK